MIYILCNISNRTTIQFSIIFVTLTGNIHLLSIIFIFVSTQQNQLKQKVCNY